MNQEGVSPHGMCGSQKINKEMNRATGDLEKPINVHLPSCILNFFFSSHEHLKQNKQNG